MLDTRSLTAALLCAALVACPDHPAGLDAGAEPPDAQVQAADGGVPDAGAPPQRCAVSLDRFLVHGAGQTRAKLIAGPEDFVGGPNAWAKAGDYLLANDKIKVALQARDRHIGPNPYGATIIDADLVREGPGQDQFGELGLFYNLSRTVDPDFFEILSAGGEGEPAIVAMSGPEAVQDYLRIKNIFNASALDLDKPLSLKLTNYFVLNPGEQRVRYVTAFCNTGQEEIVTIAGDLTDPGWTVELFNGESCTGGFGAGGMCQGIDRMSWFGYQGDGVAYGYAPYKVSSPQLPERTNATMTIAGVTGTLIGAPGLSGVSDWLNPDLKTRPGELRIPAGEARVVARDFVVGRDLGEVASIIETTRAEQTSMPTGAFAGTVTRGGAPLAGARVTLQRDSTLAAVFVTDAQGRYAGRLSTGAYLVSAWAPGSRAVPAPTEPAPVLQVKAEGTARADFALSVPQRLTVEVAAAPAGTPLPAKVTVLCATGTCPAAWGSLQRFLDAGRDAIPDNVQLIDFVPTLGTATFELPAGEYRVLVSRGPEWSVYPPDFTTQGGVPVDLRTAPATVHAVLAHVVPTTGWASADFHVHGVNSPDSHVDEASRALTFAAEGVDVLVSTDHDFLTDYAPAIRAIGAEKLLTNIIGEEVSPVDLGHTNLYPLVPDLSDPITHGAIDWGGGRGPTLSPAEIIAEGRRKGATSVHLNHPRGWPLGVFSDLRVDMDTLVTHADPAQFDAAVQPGATAGDSRMLSADFNALEVLNSGTDQFDPYLAHGPLNDWFTLLSRGLRVAAIGASDTHQRFAAAAGYWRTWVRVPNDAPDQVTPAQMSAGVNALHATVSNGPFVQLFVNRVDAAGVALGPPQAIGETVPAGPGDLSVTVDVQMPDYMDVTRVELFLHQPGDDASCPIDPSSPEAKTTRVACDGSTNINWPQASIAATQTVTLEPADREVALTLGTDKWWRWHKQVKFLIPAPATDNWVVAMVYGTRSLFPLVYPSSLSGGGAKPTPPFALTNPVFVDADGNGYDHPPFNPPPRQHAPPPPPKAKPHDHRRMTPDAILKVLKQRREMCH